jgi:hypothetical protein
MVTQHVVSRRHLLAMSAAAGTLAIGGYRDAAAQTAKRIERLDPALDQIVSTSEPIVDLATQPRRHRQCRRTAVVEGGRLSAVSRHGPQAVEIRARARVVGLQREHQCRQRDHARHAGPAGGLRGGDAPSRAGGARR